MSSVPRRAAQYIRMSTDTQDLSPLAQKEAIAKFAVANGFEVVGSYEDTGKSGLTIANRPRLRQLLRDVEDRPSFTEILVYDVSRWGRFQDADAAAYYEYHCRLHGVQVIYVGEAFANATTPANVLLKSMKRVMAAEYSRDLALKARAGQERVVSMGFHMGPLPPLGYRRCSVSADGSRRRELGHGERKVALTDRIEWILAPEAEVVLVRRICGSYASGLQLDEIAALVRAEGWRTEKDRLVSAQALRRLLQHEALIGNFVWGVKSKGGKVINALPTRRDGSVPRIIDDSTWGAVTERLANASAASRSAHTARRKGPAVDKQRPVQLRLPLDTPPRRSPYRRSIGLPTQLRDQAKEFGRGLSEALRIAGVPGGFDPRSHVLTFWSTRVRIRLLWPTAEDTWTLERGRWVNDVQHLLLVRMAALFRPADYLLLPVEKMDVACGRPLHRQVSRGLLRHWCQSPADVLGQLAAISKEASGRGRNGR